MHARLVWMLGGIGLPQSGITRLAVQRSASAFLNSGPRAALAEGPLACEPDRLPAAHALAVVARLATR